LRAIDNLDCDADFRRHNFVLANYSDAQGKPRRKVTMTRDGFAFLFMGFTSYFDNQDKIPSQMEAEGFYYLQNF
jgi:phage regulator Rha-like protein